MWDTGFTESRFLNMVLIQFLLFIWLLLCFPTTEANESFLLYNSWNQLCLAHALPTGAQGEACNPNDPNQQWRWISGLYLQNVGSGQCVTSVSTAPLFEMQSCVEGSSDQRMICSYNVIKGSHRGQTQKQLGMSASGSYPIKGETEPKKSRWQVYGASEKSICNGKNFRENRKWWRLAGRALDVSSGLNPFIISTRIVLSGSNIAMMNSSGKIQDLDGYLEVVSLAPHTLWGMNSGGTMYYAQNKLSFGQASVNWASFGDGYSFLDFTMPGKGFFVTTTDRNFCARLGITVDLWQGNDWKCVSSSVTLEDLSCGVTGCFGLIDGILHFREGITSDNPVGTGWISVGNPKYELFVKVEAGPIYELWAITSDGYPYRRLGMCDGILMGTAWELVPNLLLKDVSFGIYGPVGIAKDLDVVIILNGSPAPKRQREMDDFCTSAVPVCVHPGADPCVNSGTICNARFTPKVGDVNHSWRCLSDQVIGEDGQVWKDDGTCLYTRHSSLLPIVLRYPVLGDFEKQLWLDTFCQNQDVSGCSEQYFVNYNATSQELVCRTVAATSSCPVITGLHEDLFSLTRGSCADNPLILPLASSQFSDWGTGHSVKLYNNQAYCRKEKNGYKDVYVTIDFLFRHKICAIGTMGFKGLFVDSYRISYGVENDIWNKSSLFGSQYVFKGNVDATTLVKRYLPAPVIARWLRVTFTSIKAVKKCLQLEVYGSSLETEADSCQYYKDHLSATLDGIYNIYPKDTEVKKRVFCKGITDNETTVEYPYEELVDIEEIGCFRDEETRAMPVQYTVDEAYAITQCKAKAHAAGYEVFAVQFGVECFTGPQAHITYHKYGEANSCLDGKGAVWASSVYRIIKADKLFWPLNTTRDGAPGPIIHGKQAVNVLQGSPSRQLAHFPNHCVSNLEFCSEGLSIEFWLWFTYTLDYVSTSILKSGIGRETSRGFKMYLKYHHVCVAIHMRSTWFKACVGPLGKPTYWLHVFANWDVSGITLIVDDLEMRSQGIRTNRGSRDKKKEDVDSVLRLGNPYAGQANRYDIAIHSLTIWSRKLSEDEIEARFTKGYTVASEGETCKAVCEAKGLACDTIMTANGQKVLKRLGLTCSSFVPYNAQDQAEPYITLSEVCHGLFSVKNTSCEASKAGVRRLCRCERPVHGNFTEWSQWSFCSRTCGSGRRVRTRSCTHPAPRLGGKDCEGITIMHDDCQELPCGVQDGILHEIWLGNPDIDMTKATHIYSIRAYPKYPTFSHIIEDFTTKSNRSFYGEQFTTYFIAPESGDYKFKMECPHACWMNFRKRYKKRLIAFDIVGGPKTVSTTITDLVADTKYYMKVLSVYKAGSTEFKLGFESIASGLNVNPITKEYMSWRAQAQQVVSREVWDVRFLGIRGKLETEDFVENAPEPDFKEEISNFQLARLGHFYVQRLQAYFLATSNGDYNFYMTCSEGCYMYIDDVYIFMHYHGNMALQWTSGTTATKTLQGGKFYKLVMLHYQRTEDSDYVALGVTLPNGIQLHPIPKKYLWLEIPEKLEIERNPGQKKTQQSVANAIDGSLSTCSMTGNTKHPWLRLESQFSFTVRSVAITNQVANPSALDNVHIKVGNQNPAQRDKNALCYKVANISSGETVSYPCNYPLSGRFVVVRLYGNNRVLAVCEIVVYGERYQVAKGKYQQGIQDGRVERWQVSSSPHRARHDRYNIALYHPYSSWCANEKDANIFWEVRFVERRVIAGIITHGDPMENKWVTKAKIQYKNAETNWIYAMGRNNKKDFYIGNSVQLFKSAYYTKSLRFIPFAWFHRPCVRLAIIGSQWRGNFAWYVGKLENTTRMILSGAESAVTVDDTPGIFIPRSSLLQLCGFNIICLRNPKMCSGSFTIDFRVSVTDVSTDGIFFSTTGHNTSIVGTSVFLKDSNLVAIIRTVTRIWNVSAPADSLVGDTLEYVQIIWSYLGDIILKVKGITYTAPYTVVPRMSLAGDDLKSVIKFGGVDLTLNWVSLEVESYNVWLGRRIYSAVDGWHTEWASWGYCSKSCGNSSVQYRYRRCTNPSPKFDGLECPTLKETRPCPKPSCDNDDGVLREVWMNKRSPKFSLTNVFDGYASHLEVVANFSLSYNDGPFAERLRTFLQPSESGEFEFQLSCTYQCELWISPTDEVEGKVKIISHDASANGGFSINTLTGSYNFESGENYYIEVRSFDIKGARNHTLLTIKAPSAAVTGTGFSLVRHKPDCYHGLGVESGAIPDGLIFSNAYSSNTQFAYHGRLNGDFPHCAKTLKDQGFYVDLRELHWIVAVVIQGYIKSGNESRVTSLEIKTRLHFYDSDITDVDNVYTLYNGNEDAETIKVINLTQPMRSRYVVMWMSSYAGDGCFRVDVIGCHAGNLAYQKETEQSDGPTGSKAVDGSFGRSLSECTHAEAVDNMIWWFVDFGRASYIGEVLIVGRKDCCWDRMHNLQVRIGNLGGASSLVNPQCGELHSLWEPQHVASLSVHCEPYGYGQYLTIAREGDSDISLSEVAAFQIENDTIFSNWSDCSVTCGYGFQQRRTICIKPYYCKSVEEVRPCFAGEECEILMQNCGQLHALGETETGTYKVRPNPAIENDIYVYCDHDTDGGGWLVLQRRSASGTLNMTQSWHLYRDGFGNVSTEFWIGNKYFSQLTNHTAYEIMFLFKRANGSVLRKTKCDAFNVSSEEENYRLELGTCEGPDAEILRYSNWTEFSTLDKDNGFGLLNCTSQITGWWFGSCDSYINSKTLSCFGQSSCDYDVTMMIKPNKVDGGWTHWTSWETCDKPCGGGNSSRVRSCTHPPPTGGGDDCEGPGNKTRGCNTSPCPVIELNITMRFTQETWTAYLLQLSSSGSQGLVDKISSNILALYDNDPSVSVVVHRFKQGSVVADVTIIYEALDDQQLIVLQEDLDQDGLLNEDMPVVYTQNELVVTEVLFGPPQIIESGNTSSTSIYIKWQPPNSTVLYKLLGYRIYYKESNDTSLTMLVQAVEKNVLKIEITDLKYYTNYSVRVCAFSSAGNGVPTTAHHIMTDEYIPIAAPVIISAYNLSSTSLNISWLPVDLPLFRGIPTGYILHYRIKTSDNTTAFLNATIDDYLVTSINSSDLMKYTEYEMYMTATTIKGQGIRGEFVYFRTDEDVPSYPPDNITLVKNTSTSLLISWSAIPQEFVHGVLRAYVIEYWPVDNRNDTANATVDPWVTEIELTNLIKFTNYSIKFAGMTYKGVGNWSEVMLQTAEDIPEWGPMNLTGFNISETAANVSWSFIPQKYRHGIIIGYRVHYEDEYRHSDSVTVPASQRNIILNDLHSYTLYNISVAGITKAGEGRNRTSVLIHTNPGAPSREPWDIICSGVSSYTISLYWYRFTPGLTGSLLTGYFISYRAIEPPGATVYNVTFEAFKYNYVAEGLKGYTNYSFEMYVFNPWGRSNTSTVVCKTEEGKPLASPSNLIAISKVAPDKVHLKWDTVPDIEMAGIRRGYTVTYRKTKEVGEFVDEDEKQINIFDPQQTEIFIEGLEYYCQYSFTVRVFNTKFYGDDSERRDGETCNCLEDFYMNWCSYMPYVNTSDSGIFPPLIRSAIYGVCGNCSDFGRPKIYFETDIVGASAEKPDLVQVKQSITDQSQINFPSIGRKDAKNFLPVIDSPGSVFVTKKPSLTMIVEYMFLETILGTLPLLGFAVITALLAGIIIWCLEKEKNSKDFPRSFNNGAREGFWWAFISMTTVGYGDRAPTTVPGRIFSIMWTLYGLVITGMLVGNLTSALTASVAFTLNEVNLYQAKIAAIDNSSEFKLGLSKGAYVNKGRDFSDILTVLHAVEVGSVEGALLDMYVVASRPELQKKDSPLIVKSIIQNPSTCGIELAGHATKLRKPFLHYLQNNAAFVTSTLEKFTTPVKKSEGEIDTSEASEEDGINVLAPDSPIIKQPLLYSLICLGAAVVLGLLAHCTLCKRRRNGSAVLPVSSRAELRSALDERVSKFCENSKTTLTDIKQKHRRELMECTKRKFQVTPEEIQFKVEIT